MARHVTSHSVPVVSMESSRRVTSHSLPVVSMESSWRVTSHPVPEVSMEQCSFLSWGLLSSEGEKMQCLEDAVEEHRGVKGRDSGCKLHT